MPTPAAAPPGRPVALLLSWMPEEMLARLRNEFPEVEIIDAREPAVFAQDFPRATITYGVPPVDRLNEVPGLRWIQLTSAGVPADLCPAGQRCRLTVTNLAGLYGPSIAEHALTLMGMLARNLHLALRHQIEKRWDRCIAGTMSDLHGRTLAVVGLGSIGRSIARLARAYGMRVVGCRRTDRLTAEVDRLYPCRDLHTMLGEADYVAVAAPLTRHTEGMLGSAEFGAMKRGVVYVNVSRGGVAQEPALLEALRSGQVAAAGLDVFAAEPLAAGHPFWSMPQVVISPHYSGETVNASALPAERFARNLRSWLDQGPLEGVVDLEWGY